MPRKMQSPIHSTKHIGQQSVATVGLGAIANLYLAEVVAAPTSTVARHVHIGSVIKAVYIEMWITSDDATQGSSIVTLEKVTSTGTDQTYAQSQALQGYANKSAIFYTSQGIVPPNVQSGIPLIRGWFKIPKGFQRMGVDDRLVLNISGITNGANYCGCWIFKEYE